MNTYSKQLDLLGRRYLRWLSRVVPSIAFLDRIALRIDRSRVHTRWPVAVRVRETRPGHVSPIVRLDRGWSLLIGYIQLPSTIPPMFLLFRNSSTDFDYILVLFLFFFFFFFYHTVLVLRKYKFRSPRTAAVPSSLSDRAYVCGEARARALISVTRTQGFRNPAVRQADRLATETHPLWRRWLPLTHPHSSTARHQ